MKKIFFKLIFFQINLNINIKDFLTAHNSNLDFKISLYFQIDIIGSLHLKINAATAIFVLKKAQIT